MPEDSPNVLFLFSDEHSFRCLSHRDTRSGEPVDTPNLDRLARDGTAFENTYCQMPLCTPSRFCMLTGREVRGAGAWNNSSSERQIVLPPRAETIPETLGESGYHTALVGKMHLGGSRQFVGFDDRPYGDLAGESGHQWEPLDRVGGLAIGDRIQDAGITEIPESQLQEYNTMRESLAWIREHDAASDDPWFLTASFSRPHFPLTAPSRYFRRYWDPDTDHPTELLSEPKVGHEGDTTDHPMTEEAVEQFGTADIERTDQQRARAAYFACVDFLDDIIGEFLATLRRDGLLDDTIVVYASDHGELAGEHGLWWKHTWHEAATRVPLVIQTPEHRHDDAPTTTVETPVGLVDLFPTICGLTDTDPPADLDGEDLSEAVLSGTEPDRDPVVCDNLTRRWGDGTEFRLVRDGDYKYVRFRDAPELFFDIRNDPLEQRNLAKSSATPDEAAVTALERLREFVDSTMNFDVIEKERARDMELQDEYPLTIQAESPSGNCYTMPDGTVIDMDASLYEPAVVAEGYETVFDRDDR